MAFQNTLQSPKSQRPLVKDHSQHSKGIPWNRYVAGTPPKGIASRMCSDRTSSEPVFEFFESVFLSSSFFPKRKCTKPGVCPQAQYISMCVSFSTRVERRDVSSARYKGYTYDREFTNALEERRSTARLSRRLSFQSKAKDRTSLNHLSNTNGI